MKTIISIVLLWFMIMSFIGLIADTDKKEKFILLITFIVSVIAELLIMILL